MADRKTYYKNLITWILAFLVIWTTYKVEVYFNQIETLNNQVQYLQEQIDQLKTNK